jgi:hypothetical protein
MPDTPPRLAPSESGGDFAEVHFNIAGELQSVGVRQPILWKMMVVARFVDYGEIDFSRLASPMRDDPEA